ncbi:hypothetical protein EYF80_051024 [Liparis tanakae]|uniref:Uncharacterized protein n=1 Tax=Liparis tanakae TaxID=230148 RepID=A0A4Z2FCA9_9TELE|nr:hypothetical protein EYF80_051024 [Liparis tanakae]
MIASYHCLAYASDPGDVSRASGVAGGGVRHGGRSPPGAVKSSMGFPGRGGSSHMCSQGGSGSNPTERNHSTT